MEKKGFSLLTIFGLILLMIPNVSWAEAPAIPIDLNFIFEESFDKTPYYPYGEPIQVRIKVRNNSGEDILISKGFSSKFFYLEMRLRNPAGRLLVAKKDLPYDKSLDGGLLPFVLYKGHPVRVAPCEILPAHWSIVQKADDLMEHFAMELPGYYSAQVQVSAMVFKKEICDIHDYQWVGMLKSKTKSFYMEGGTKVEIIPNQWSLAWKKRKEAPDVQVNIYYPGKGRAMEDHKTETIRLNNVGAKRIEKEKGVVKAYFEAAECINSLGRLKVKQSYPVVILGRLMNDQPFGGGQRVTVVE